MSSTEDTEFVGKTVTGLAWKLYREAFTDGDFVSCEDDCGDFHFGKLKTSEKGITLTTRGRKAVRLGWDEIVFMANDGFPVSKIMGMTFEEAEQRCDEQSSELIRRHLIQLSKATPAPSYSYPRARLGLGCPFETGYVEVEKFLYAGNNGPQFWGEDDEEIIILRDPNGARMHSFDISHIFLWEDEHDGVSVQKFDPLMKSF